MFSHFAPTHPTSVPHWCTLHWLTLFLSMQSIRLAHGSTRFHTLSHCHTLTPSHSRPTPHSNKTKKPPCQVLNTVHTTAPRGSRDKPCVPLAVVHFPSVSLSLAFVAPLLVWFFSWGHGHLPKSVSGLGAGDWTLDYLWGAERKGKEGGLMPLVPGAEGDQITTPTLTHTHFEII